MKIKKIRQPAPATLIQFRRYHKKFTESWKAIPLPAGMDAGMSMVQAIGAWKETFAPEVTSKERGDAALVVAEECLTRMELLTKLEAELEKVRISLSLLPPGYTWEGSTADVKRVHQIHAEAVQGSAFWSIAARNFMGMATQLWGEAVAEHMTPTEGEDHGSAPGPDVRE